jgi:mannose-6-phosphate isomerase-like protein (cupin superfamily)
MQSIESFDADAEMQESARRRHMQADQATNRSEGVARARALEPREGRALWHLGALMTFKALGTETGGQFWALEGMADARMAVPLHSHSREDEIWYVVEGEITFTIGDQRRTVGPGGFAYIPRNTPHTFQIRSGTARWFGFGTPAGLDTWFFETGVPAERLELPPATLPMPDVATIVASLSAYGTETLGPPPAREE